MCKVKPPIAERHDVVVWEEMEIINKFNYFLSYPIIFTLTTTLLRNEDIVTYDGLSCSIR